MTASPVGLAPPQYGLQSPRPDLMQAAGTYALAAEAPAFDVAPTKDLKTLHTDLVEKFEASEDASRTNREKAERDIDYYDGKQLTDAEAKELQRRGQPPQVINLIKPKIKYLQGLEKTQRTDPSARPRTPKHDDDAFAATSALRFVMDSNRFDQTRSKVWKDICAAGWGGNEITVEQKGSGNPRIVVRRCQWDRMFWDPYSGEEDFSDANYLGLVIWMDREEAALRYGEEASKVFDETVAAVPNTTFDDKPRLTTWVDHSKRKRIRVVQMYYKGADGAWYFCEFTKGGFLQMGVSPWVDDDGNPEHAYEWGSAYVDRDNNRYGEIRDLIDPQDAVNKRHSKLLHLSSVRQTFSTEGSLGKMTTRDLKTELAKPDGHVSLSPGVEYGKDFGVIPTNDMAAAHLQLLQEDKAHMAGIGPNAAMLGKQKSDQSGRAIIAQQQGGAIEVGSLTDTLRDIDFRTYRKVWRRIRQFWQAEEWVSVTDDVKNLKWVGLNVPMQDPATGGPAIDPMTGQPMLQNPVAALDVDIKIEDAPDVGVLQDETFQAFAGLAGMVPSLQQMPASFWVRVSTLPNKSEILQAIEEMEQGTAQAQAPNPMQQAAMAAELENKQADTANKAAQAKKNEAQAFQTMAETGLNAMQAMSPQPQPSADVVPFPGQQPTF